jgi:translation elongation factor P/translation initiation factor 5A
MSDIAPWEDPGQGSDIFQMPARRVEPGMFVMIDGRPCRVAKVVPAAGGEVRIIGVDMFAPRRSDRPPPRVGFGLGNTAEVTLTSSDEAAARIISEITMPLATNIDCPVVRTKDWTVIDITGTVLTLQDLKHPDSTWRLGYEDDPRRLPGDLPAFRGMTARVLTAQGRSKIDELFLE